MGLLDEILETIKTVKDNITNRIGKGIDDIKQTAQALPEKLDQLVNGVKETVDNLAEKIGGKLMDVVESFSDKVKDAANSIANAISLKVTEIKDGLDTVADKIRGKIGDIADAIGDIRDSISAKIKESVDRLTDGIKETAGNIAAKISEGWDKLYGGIKEAWDSATERIRAVLQDLLERLIKIGEKLLSAAFDIALWINETGIPEAKRILADTKDGIQKRKDAAVDLWAAVQRGDVGNIANALLRLTEITTPSDLTSSLIILSMIGAMLPQTFTAYAKPSLELILQEVNAKIPVELPNTETLVRAAMRRLITQDGYRGYMAKYGYAPQVADLILEANRPLPPQAAIQEAYLRGFITEAQHDEYLRRYGYTDRDIALQKALYYVIPGVSDIIRMAVREAFTPEVAQRFGQYEDLPQIFVEWAAKQGLSKEWAERYWASHWNLPSATQGFEMLHRRIIDVEELKLLLRALDVMPYWRDKLIQLSYLPYTRVDLRRMYSMGILTEDDVYNAYRDLGYDDEKARNLTAFTVRYYAPDEETTLDKYRELTRTIYANAYKKGLITRDEYLQYLKGIGYRDEDAELLASISDAELTLQYTKEDTIPLRSQTQKLVLDAYERGLLKEVDVRETLANLQYTQDEIEWYIALTDYNKEVSLKTLYLESVHKQYIERTLTKAEAVSKLGALYPTPKEQEHLFEVWDIEREARTRKLTEAQYRAALQRGIITVEEYAEELRGLGYAEKYVDILVKLATGRG